ncbi:MAG: MucB/RseB C-terminal domain-containing protein [Sedimenticola sp.]|nr:MucB/RseB C-terminal domain-containing protein [Sedimenticola sp.]
MVMRGLVFIFSLFLLALPAQGSTEGRGGDVRDWLQRMVNAVHSLNYEGTFVYLHNNQLESMRIVHNADEDNEKERLLSLNGVPREVIRDNASVTCIAPDAQSVSIANRVGSYGFRAVFAADISQLSNLYDFHMLGEARVADRPAMVLAIVPRDAFRYGYRIYLDKQHALPLKTDMLDRSGEALSQLMFTQLQVHSGKSEIETISLEGKEHYRWELQKPIKTLQEKNGSRWSFEGLPEGFKIILYSRRKAGERGGEVDHFVLSDGLASLSVYVEPAADDDLRGGSNIGTINAYGSVREGFQVTVVGEVPALTVEHIASALRNNLVE